MTIIDNISPKNSKISRNGTQSSQSVSDQDSRALLKAILTQLKILNLQMSFITSVDVNEDVFYDDD